MKGLFFSKPLEFRLETPAEGLVQGQAFQGVLAVTNRGGDTLEGQSLEIGLTYGNFKKIKANDPDAYQPIQNQKLGKPFSLKPGEEHREDWNLTLDGGCPITNQEGAVFLIYGGNLAQPGAWSKIDLQIQLASVLGTFVTTMENYFAFAATPPRHEDGYTEVRFTPPSSYPTIDEIFLRMRLDEEMEMELLFQCRLRKFDRSAGKGVMMVKQEYAASLSPGQYQTFSGQPNRQLFRETIATALAEVAPPPVKKK